MTAVMTEIKKYEKMTTRATHVIFESDFSDHASRRVSALIEKYNPGHHVTRRKNIHIYAGKDPKRILAWAIAQRAREAREGQGWTQEELAEKAGIARPNIARLERGLHIPTLTTLEKVAKALAIDMNILTAPPEATEEAMREFEAAAEEGIEEWGRELEKEDAGR